jgi:NhaP-type Na+/H+ or K+/H+ antiporter
MERFWELMTYMANTLIFLIVGVVIAGKVDFTWQQLGILILIYIALNLFRLLMIMVLYPLMKRMGYGLSRRESVILTWGGLRGALGMTLALMVSYTPGIPEEIRSQILFFTAGIVTLTLSINATTMRWLLNRLGLIHVP